MEFKQKTLSNDLLNITIAFSEKDLVFPVHLAILTIFFAPIFVFLFLLGLFLIFRGDLLSLSLMSLDFQMAIFLSAVFLAISSIYWIYTWKVEFAGPSSFDLRIDNKYFTIYRQRPNRIAKGTRYNLVDLRHIHVAHSDDGEAHGWKLVLELLHGGKIINQKLFIVNDGCIHILYDLLLSMNRWLQKLGRESPLRPSELFLRRVSEMRQRS